ncbi:hypothetical protein BJ170DRAFT_590895 [Xylariales sp. AK1849]|nr:hypothetical protein BJ170DRAFT_590895 [Xylariales sp. AK1849]
MHLLLSGLFLVSTGLIGAFAFPPFQDDLLARASTPSPDMACGVQACGTYHRPSQAPCCSSSGYCGTGDGFCLTSLGCQSRYAPPGVDSCYVPEDKVMVVADIVGILRRTVIIVTWGVKQNMGTADGRGYESRRGLTRNHHEFKMG